jgi:hypothetical protein
LSSQSSRALISWVPRERGGRERLPSGPQYSTVARFEDDPRWPHEAWSLVLEFERSFNDGRCTLATVRFLAPSGPSDLLEQGNRFELLEGRRRVAKGVVLPEGVNVPAELNAFETALIG